MRESRTIPQGAGVRGRYTPPEFTYARHSFIFSAAMIALGGVAWMTLSDMTIQWRVFWGTILGLAVFVAFPIMMRWVDARQDIWVQSQAAQAKQANAQAPSSTPLKEIANETAHTPPAPPGGGSAP